MRSHRAQSILNISCRRPQCLLLPAFPRSVQVRAATFPSPTRFEPKLSRFAQYQNHSEDILKVQPRNPFDYVEANRIRLRKNEYHKKRIYIWGFGIAVCVLLQVYIVLSFGEDPGSDTSKGQTATQPQRGRGRDRLDASPAEQAALQGKEVVVHLKPGTEKIVDEDGTELVETGTSTIPHFPRTIQLPIQVENAGDVESPPKEEYTLLGLGVRTVSFLSIQVYVVGLYVRNTDMATLQSAFVRHVNPIASALIPGEKDALRNELLEADKSLDLWDKVLRETKIKSAVRIVPVRNTDFQHLRDGWVRGITGKTQDATRAGKKEFDDEKFGEAMKAFKSLFGGKGKAPWGSTVVLTRDEDGKMEMLYEAILREKAGGKDVVRLLPHELLGVVTDERISRQIWLGYLGGKNVSSPGARKSIASGVMELCERPLGTVEVKIS